MPTLDPLPPVDDLFDYRGASGTAAAPPLWLPHHQGDVFENVEIPGLTYGPDEPRLALLFLHPCTMRRGAVLKGAVTMVKVSRLTSKVRAQPTFWATRFAEMPLPDLAGTGQNTHGGVFLEIGTVQSGELHRGRRVATLSLHGRTIMQQRIINHFTRLVPTLDELQQATRAVETEIELQADWVEAACKKSGGIADVAVQKAEADFDGYMSATGADESLRAILQNPERASGVVMETQREIRRRFE